MLTSKLIKKRIIDSILHTIYYKIKYNYQSSLTNLIFNNDTLFAYYLHTWIITR